MNMTTEKLLSLTKEALPAFLPTTLQPIEKGGSSRCFYRIHSETQESVILVHDLGEKEENRHYAALATFLVGHGIPVPAVCATNHSKGLLWLEDLGEQDLWTSRNEPWEIRRSLYESVLQGIALLHRITIKNAEELHLQKEFDEHLYRWEQEYFVKHCLGDIFGISEKTRSELLTSKSMQKLATRLAEIPRQLVHRDFQSQNIMIREGRAWFIDFQGMRPGLAQYDLASLLCDPYVTIAHEERAELLKYYAENSAKAGIPADENFESIFWQCAVQRLMQALGAYGFLSIHRGKSSFRLHITPALKNLREALTHLHSDDQLDELADFVANLEDPSMSKI